MQQLSDLYEVEFNEVRRSPLGNVVIHDQNSDMVILLGTDTTMIVGEPYLVPVSRYGKGLKKKTLVRKQCCWMGSNIASRVGDELSGTYNPTAPYRLVETR